MVEWVSLRPILDICTRDMGYEEGGKLRVRLWRQEASEKQMKFKVEHILAESMVWWRWESGRHGKSQGGPEGESTDSKG